jgi:hypothetical protein
MSEPLSSGKGVGVRLFVGGSAEAVAAFRAIGDAGKQAFNSIAAGATTVAAPGLVVLSRSVDEAKTKVKDLAAETGATGRILGGFGASGIATAAALAGVALAIDRAKKAMAFGDEIADSATKVGVTTKYLQELRFAIHETGGEVQDADAALRGFSSALGGAESGISPKLLKAFKSLGFSQEDLKQLKDDVPSALTEVMRRINGLSSEAERAAVADKLGIGPLLPLIRQGAERFADLQEEASKLGYVMRDDVAQNASEAHDKLEALSKVVDVQLSTAFVELAPYIVEATEKFADFTKGVARFLDDPKVRATINAVAAFVGDYTKHVDPLGAAIAAGQSLDRDLSAPDMFNGGVDEDDPDLIHMRAAVAAAKGKGRRSLIDQSAKPKTKPNAFAGRIAEQINPEDLLNSFDPVSGKENTRPKTATERAFFQANGFYPGEQAAEKVKIEFSADLKTLDQAVTPWMEKTREQVRDTFSEGISAAFNGNLLDFIKSKFLNSLANSFADTLTDAWSHATSGGLNSGGGATGALLDGLSWVFGIPTARHALGGAVMPGQVSSVAEYGTELAMFGRAGQVYSHDETVRMLEQIAGGGGGRAGGGVTVNTTYAPTYQVTGSGPELDRLRGEMQRDRDTFHGRVVGTINDAIDRRQIKQA